MTLNEANPVWLYKRTGAIRIRCWPDEDVAVVYREESGDTHLVDAFSLELLKRVGDEPKSARQLEGELSSLVAQDERMLLASSVESSLLQLQSVDLIAAISP